MQGSCLWGSGEEIEPSDANGGVKVGLAGFFDELVFEVIEALWERATEERDDLGVGGW